MTNSVLISTDSPKTLECEVVEESSRPRLSTGMKAFIAFMVVVGILQVLNFLFFTASSVTHAVSLITHG